MPSVLLVPGTRTRSMCLGAWGWQQGSVVCFIRCRLGGAWQGTGAGAGVLGEQERVFFIVSKLAPGIMWAMASPGLLTFQEKPSLLIQEKINTQLKEGQPLACPSVTYDLAFSCVTARNRALILSIVTTWRLIRSFQSSLVKWTFGTCPNSNHHRYVSFHHFPETNLWWSSVILNLKFPEG